VPEDEIDYEARAADRLNLFSDAVVAIAITLLAIDLPLPEGHTVSQFWSSVRHDASHYAAFLISFFAIAAAWRDHHDIFRYVRRVDSRLRTINTFWLLMIVLNPFATRLLTVSGTETLQVHALRFSFYALLQVLESAAMFGVLAHMISRHLAPDIPRVMAIDLARQSFNLILGFGLSIPLFFVWSNAWVLWIVVPLLVSRWRHISRRKRNRGAGHASGDTAPADTGRAGE
jgi:uncharacterized membrane protein